MVDNSKLYCKWPNPYAKSNAKACAFWDVKDDMDIPLWKSASSMMNCGVADIMCGGKAVA